LYVCGCTPPEKCSGVTTDTVDIMEPMVSPRPRDASSRPPLDPSVLPRRGDGAIGLGLSGRDGDGTGDGPAVFAVRTASSLPPPPPASGVTLPSRWLAFMIRECRGKQRKRL
jgi:hypothetical protein